MPLKDFEEFTKDKPELAKELAEVFDKAGAHPKLTEANKDLTTQRAAWDTEKKELMGKLTTAETALKTAQDAGENTPLVNKLKADVEALNKRLNDADEATQKATADKLNADLESNIIASAGNTFNPKQVATMMKAEGLAAIKEGKTEFYTKDADGNLVHSNHTDSVAAYLKGNAHMVKPSNEGGSGESPKGGKGGGEGAGLLSNPAENL